jgi:hypothetical protein
MGTWGVGPFDNDDAADMVAKLMKPLERVETQKSNASYHYNEARAVSQFLLLSHGTDILGGPGLLQVVRVLARIRSDAEWIAGFRTHVSIMRQLDDELNAVLHRMEQCKGCKEYRREAENIAFDAKKVSLADVKREVAKRPIHARTRVNRTVALKKRRKAARVTKVNRAIALRKMKARRK